MPSFNIRPFNASIYMTGFINSEKGLEPGGNMKCFHSFLRSMLVSGSLIWIPKYPKFEAISMLWLLCLAFQSLQKTSSDITKMQKDELCSRPKEHLQGFFIRVGAEGWNTGLTKNPHPLLEVAPPPSYYDIRSDF